MVFIDNYVLEIRGEVNGIFSSFLTLKGGREAALEKFIHELRYDREKNMYGPGIPDENPSLDPSEVEFFYMPSLQRKQMYSNDFPIFNGLYRTVDAFVCLGSRFGLKQLQVWVEICYADVKEGVMWANIIYVSDSLAPAAIVRPVEFTHALEDEEILAAIERQKALNPSQ